MSAQRITTAAQSREEYMLARALRRWDPVVSRRMQLVRQILNQAQSFGARDMVWAAYAKPDLLVTNDHTQVVRWVRDQIRGTQVISVNDVLRAPYSRLPRRLTAGGAK